MRRRNEGPPTEETFEPLWDGDLVPPMYLASKVCRLPSILSPTLTPVMLVVLYCAFDGDVLLNKVYAAIYLSLPHVPLYMGEAVASVLSFIVWTTFFGNMWITGAKKINGSTPKKNIGEEVVWWSAMNALVYLGSIFVLRVFSSDPDVSLKPVSGFRLVVELFSGVFLYDFLFYWIHLAFHRVFPVVCPFFCSLHLSHHDYYRDPSRSLTAIDTFRQHWTDGGLQVVINILVQRNPVFWEERHLLSKYLHNVVVTYLLVEAHSGYDLPFMSHRVFPSLFGGSVRHERHHQTGRVYYHQFFKYLDDYFGFVEDQQMEEEEEMDEEVEEVEEVWQRIQ